MKRLLTLITALALCASLTACNSSPETSGFEGLELAKIHTDRITYNTLDSIESASDIAVIGEFIDEPVQNEKYTSLPAFDHEVISNVTSTSTLKISRVLKGDINSGDEIKVSVRYGVVDGQLITFSGLTPMQKGDEWVFFLKKQEGADVYWLCGDCDGRYPTKRSADNEIMPLSEAPELGVYDESDFNRAIYDELVKKYGI